MHAHRMHAGTHCSRYPVPTFANAVSGEKLHKTRPPRWIALLMNCIVQLPGRAARYRQQEHVTYASCSTIIMISAFTLDISHGAFSSSEQVNARSRA